MIEQTAVVIVVCVVLSKNEKMNNKKLNIKKGGNKMRKILLITSLLLLILTVSCTQQETSRESETGAQTVTGRVVIKIDEAEDASQEVCKNAQTYGQCNILNTDFREGYREACCNEHKLCC